MTAHQVKISTESGLPKVSIDGADITHALGQADLHLRPGRRPRLVIEVDLIDVTTLGAQETEVVLGCGHDALVALGWTPPAPDGA